MMDSGKMKLEKSPKEAILGIFDFNFFILK